MASHRALFAFPSNGTDEHDILDQFLDKQSMFDAIVDRPYSMNVWIICQRMTTRTINACEHVRSCLRVEQCTMLHRNLRAMSDDKKQTTSQDMSKCSTWKCIVINDEYDKKTVVF
jgi:hypothetical protein